MEPSLVSFERRAGYLLVKLPGTISMDNYVVVEKDVSGVLTGKNDRIVLDFSATANIYSSGMGLILRLRKKVLDGGGTLALVNVSDRCRQLLASVHLDKMIPVYATDVEFEVSQDEVWEKKTSDPDGRFALIARTEGGLRRVAVSGQMMSGRDLSELKRPLIEKGVRHYVFDLTGLEAADSVGAAALSEAVMAIHTSGGHSVAYGAPGLVSDLLVMLNLEDYLPSYDNEREALEAIGKA